ncbi:17148_t:CDS:2, partial [Dentiscutata heterogama]
KSKFSKVKNGRNAIYRQNGPSFGFYDLSLSQKDKEGRTWMCCKGDYERSQKIDNYINLSPPP